MVMTPAQFRALPLSQRLAIRRRFNRLRLRRYAQRVGQQRRNRVAASRKMTQLYRMGKQDLIGIIRSMIPKKRY
jgi:hypothetical protein